jgi:hypothetical protein
VGLVSLSLPKLPRLGEPNDPAPGSSEPPCPLAEEENDSDVYDEETLPSPLGEEWVIGIGSAWAAARERERSVSSGAVAALDVYSTKIRSVESD